MTSKSVALLSHDECCGCKACGDVCSKNAINFVLDEEGFYYPRVNDYCIDCGLCTKVCPAMNAFDGCDSAVQKFIGCLDKNRVRRDSGSSGGMFGLLASRLITEGYEICGAAFDENLQLKHCFVTTNEGVERLKKSKYLQSDCSGIYRIIKQKVKDSHRLMFVGTPCQCAALKHYLGQLSSNVIIVDFACHGVPSQDLFDKCMRYYEKQHDCKIISYSFRHKPKRYGAPKNFLLYIKKGGVVSPVEGKYYEEPFYCGFQKYITLRPSCYECKFARTERVSDITLADFWGVEKLTNRWDRTNTPSLIICNTHKGWELFGKIEGSLDSLFFSKSESIAKNASLKAPTELPAVRAILFADLQKLPFEEVVRKHLTPSFKKKIILGMYYAIPFTIRKKLLKYLHL